MQPWLGISAAVVKNAPSHSSSPVAIKVSGFHGNQKSQPGGWESSSPSFFLCFHPPFSLFCSSLFLLHILVPPLYHSLPPNSPIPTSLPSLPLPHPCSWRLEIRTQVGTLLCYLRASQPWLLWHELPFGPNIVCCLSANFTTRIKITLYI